MRTSAFLLLLTAAMVATVTGAAVGSVTTSPSAGGADHLLLDQVFEDARLSEQATELDAGDWLVWRVRRLVDQLLERIRLDPKTGSALASALLTAGLVIGGLLAITGLVALVMLVSSALERRRPGEIQGAPDMETRTVLAIHHDPGWWSDALDRALSAGQSRAALDALWWWLAGSLAGSDAELSWTCRDLLRHTGRSDLSGALRGLERLAYRPDDDTIDAIAQLATELRSRVAVERA